MNAVQVVICILSIVGIGMSLGLVIALSRLN